MIEELQILNVVDLDIVVMLLEGFKFGLIISGTTLILAQAINFGIKLLERS